MKFTENLILVRLFGRQKINGSFLVSVCWCDHSHREMGRDFALPVPSLGCGSVTSASEWLDLAGDTSSIPAPGAPPVSRWRLHILGTSRALCWVSSPSGRGQGGCKVGSPEVGASWGTDFLHISRSQVAESLVPSGAKLFTVGSRESGGRICG